MSEQTTEATETVTEATEQQAETTKPTETVEFWREQAKKQEKRAKENAGAAKRLADLEDAQKSDTEKAADRISKAEAEAASVPTKVAGALRDHLVTLHKIDKDDAELFLTATDPELLLKQVTRLLARSDEQATAQKKSGNHVPREGNTSKSANGDGSEREFVNELWASAD